jgi:hypothetical protein
MKRGAVEIPKGITRAEQETVIRWDEEERVVWIWSASPVVLRRLAKLGVPVHSEGRWRDGTLHGRDFRVPLARFSWGLRRSMSDAQRARLREGGFLRKTPTEALNLSTEQGAEIP